MSSKQHYILGTSEDELRRLGFQHQIWAAETTALWRRAGFGPGQHLLDLGAGPGFASFDLAHLVGTGGSVTAVDNSDTYLDYLTRQAQALGLTQVSGVKSDAETLDLPGSFDGAFVRWMLCFSKDPSRVISRAAALLKPGASLAVMDYFNYPAARVMPVHPATLKMFEAFYESVKVSGGNYDIGADVPALMRSHGFETTSVENVSRMGGPDSQVWKWLNAFVGTFVPTLVESKFVTAVERDAIVARWEELKSNPDALFYAPPVIQVVGRKL